MPPLTSVLPSDESDMLLTPSIRISGPNDPAISSANISQVTIRFEFNEHEKRSLPLLENYKPLILSIFDFSLYFPILPNTRRSIKFIAESSLPIANVLTLSGRNLTALIPH